MVDVDEMGDEGELMPMVRAPPAFIRNRTLGIEYPLFSSSFSFPLIRRRVLHVLHFLLPLLPSRMTVPKREEASFSG